MLNKTNEQKRLVGSKKFYNSKKVIATTALASLLVVSPVTTSLNGTSLNDIRNVLNPSYVKAADELASVDIIQNVTVGGSDEARRTLGNPSTFDLQITGNEIVKLDLLQPKLISQFYAEEFEGLLVDGGSAQVKLEILPITKENVPALYTAVDGVTTTVTELTDEVGQLLNEIIGSEGVLSGIISIEGLDEVLDALDALNNLEEALDSLTAYTDVGTVTISPDGVISVEYGDGLGQHLEDTINLIVIELLNDLAEALEGLNIELLEGGLTTENILEVVDALEELPILGLVLAPLLGEGIIGQLLEKVGGLLGPIVDPILKEQAEGAVGVLTGALEDLINGLLGTVGNLLVNITNLTANLSNGTILELANSLAALHLIGGSKVEITDIQVDESVYGEVEVFGATVDNAVIDINLLTTKGDSTIINFGEAPEDEPEDPEDPQEPQDPEDPEEEPEQPEDPEEDPEEEPEQPEDPEEKPEVKDPIIEEDDSDDGEVTKDDDDKDKDGKKLPKTATSAFNMLLAGLLAMAAGAAGLFTRKRKLQ